MQFGPHAPFDDPLNLALARSRLDWLKYLQAMRIATPGNLLELTGLDERIAAHYQASVDHFSRRAEVSA